MAAKKTTRKKTEQPAAAPVAAPIAVVATVTRVTPVLRGRWTAYVQVMVGALPLERAVGPMGIAAARTLALRGEGQCPYEVGQTWMGTLTTV